jgi:hypothetical protein
VLCSLKTMRFPRTINCRSLTLLTATRWLSSTPSKFTILRFTPHRRVFQALVMVSWSSCKLGNHSFASVEITTATLLGQAETLPCGNTSVLRWLMIRSSHRLDHCEALFRRYCCMEAREKGGRRFSFREPGMGGSLRLQPRL